MAEEVKDTYTKVKRLIGGREVECEVCNDVEEVFHRTYVKNLKGILRDGALLPSKETGAVSMSAAEKHTYGGTVRLRFNRDDIPELEQMCYFNIDNPGIEIYLKERDRLWNEEGSSPNRADATLGATLGAYKSECEVFSKKAIPIEKVKGVEYWIATILQFIENSNVTCINRPPVANAWSDGTWEKALSEMKIVRSFAKKLGVPFKVDSCFNQVNTGFHSYIKLTDENIEKLSQGETVVETQGVPPLGNEGSCKC